MAALENKVLVRQELMPSKNGSNHVLQDVNTFEAAINNPIISNSSSEDIASALRLCFQKLGIRAANLPTQEEKLVLIDFIYTNYGKHTLKELLLAFDLAITGRLDVDATHYENFTCLYLASIIASYRKWAIEQNKFIKPKNYQMLEENKELTDQEKADWVMEWKDMPEINIELIPLLFYDFIDSKGIIKITNEQKWAYTAKGVTYVKAKLQDEIGICKTNDAYLAYNKFQNQESTGFDKEFAGRIKNRAKRLIVYDYLKDNL